MRHGIRVGWTAARMERRGRPWISAREMDVDRDRWAVSARCDRGFTSQLPDLAIWVEPYELPCAVIVESGNRRNDRQNMILKGWRDAIHNGHYARVQYDCSSRSGAERIRQLAKQVSLDESTFSAIVQPTADQITALPPADQTSEQPAPEPEPVPAPARPAEEPSRLAPIRRPAPYVREQSEPPARWSPTPETAQEHDARKQRYHDLLGTYDSLQEETPQRRWRR
jgi:hypothetical protein